MLGKHCLSIIIKVIKQEIMLFNTQDNIVNKLRCVSEESTIIQKIKAGPFISVPQLASVVRTQFGKAVHR